MPATSPTPSSSSGCATRSSRTIRWAPGTRTAINTGRPTLIDARGHVRYATFGEGEYSQTETAIRALLAEAGAPVGGMSHPTDVVVPSQQATPETYVGTARAEGWLGAPEAGTPD